MTPLVEPYASLLAKAQRALQQGNRLEARRLSQNCVKLQPQREEGWLLLAALASPKASITYLQQALNINPDSQRARKGMHWAIQRLRASSPPAQASISQPRTLVAQTITSDAMARQRPVLMPWALAVALLMLGLAVWFGSPTFSLAFNNGKHLSLAQVQLSKQTRTPTPTATFTPRPTSTPTPTPTITPSPTP